MLLDSIHGFRAVRYRVPTIIEYEDILFGNFFANFVEEGEVFMLVFNAESISRIQRYKLTQSLSWIQFGEPIQKRQHRDSVDQSARSTLPRRKCFWIRFDFDL